MNGVCWVWAILMCIFWMPKAGNAANFKIPGDDLGVVLEQVKPHAHVPASIRHQILVGSVRLFDNELKAQLGISDRTKLISRVNEVLKYGEIHHAIPDSIIIGIMATGHAEYGGSIASEWNFYFEDGKFKVARYTNYAVHMGEGVSLRGEVYFGVCYGDCYGGEREGYYLAFDAAQSLGIGDSFFAELGIDLTDLVSSQVSATPFTTNPKAITIGFGINLGLGAGATLSIFDYNMREVSEYANLSDAFGSVQF